MQIAPPPAADYGFYTGYILNAPDTDLITALNDNWLEIKGLISSLTPEQAESRYEAGKWTLKEVVMHLVDAERNFGYRIFRISRGDQSPLPAYDPALFIANSNAANRDITAIMSELEILRMANIAMFAGMSPAMLDMEGPARNIVLSVRALGFALVGHVLHHQRIIREKYLAAALN